MKLWEDKEVFINDVFEDKVPNYFIKQIKNFNIENSKLQINTINFTINLLNKKKDLSEINKIVEKQVKKATDWCKKYGEEINEKSNFISRYYINRY